MKRIAFVIASLLLSASALAQTNGIPPTQKPAGSPGKFHTAASGHRHHAKHRKHHKHRHHTMTRAEQRSAKVGDKPIN